MVEALHRGLAAPAERALADRMVGIALELHHPALAVARQHAAARRALATDGGEPGGHAGHELLVGHDEGQDLLGRLLAAGGGRGRARGRHDLEEVPSIH